MSIRSAIENASIAAANVFSEKTRAACRTQNDGGWLMAIPASGFEVSF
jgi:hypothetical protein